MTGAEHYIRAEKILAQFEGRDVPTEIAIALATAAQVHATLAEAAATATGALSRTEWIKATLISPDEQT